MGEVFSSFVRFFVKDEVSSEADRVERAARDAAEGMDEAAEAAGTRLKGGFEKAKTAAGTLARGVVGLGAGIAGGVTALMGLAMSTQETVEDMGKLQTAFADAGHSSETAQAVFNGMVGILGEYDQAVEASNHLAELTSSEQELATWTDIAAGVYAKFGDSLPLEGLTEAANHTAKLGEVQGPLADALEWLGVSTEDFNAQLAACTTEQERSSLITSTLNGLYGEAGKQYQEVNADLIAARQSQADWNTALAEAGKVVQPISTAITNMGTQVIQWLVPHLQTLANKVTEFTTNHLPGIQAKVQAVWNVVQGLIPVAAGLLAGFLAYKAINGTIAAVNTIMDIWKARTLLMAAAQKALNLALSANPIGLVVGLVAGLVAAFVTAYTTSETFRNKVNSVFATVKSVVTGAINVIKGALNFEWKWPKVKLPHFSFTGSINPLDWPTQGLPKVGVEWYAKGGVFDQPTIFATAAGLKGVGEAGPEAVAPVSTLMGYIRQAVAEAQGGGFTANVNVTTGETDPAKLARMIAREQRREAYAYGAV